MLGVGLPEAVQLRVTLSLSSIVTLEGLVTIDGASGLLTTAYCKENIFIVVLSMLGLWLN